MNDTIAAISTTLGVGAISIVRVSGNDAIKIVNSIFSSDLENKESHTITYGYIKNKDEIIDEVLVSLMKAPKTFTKEDVVEINCHGGIATTNKVLELLLNKGCRLAEPGEFTKRAFLNGRIDLTQAESVMDLIDSKSEAKRKVSINALSGNVSNMIRNLRQEILEGLLAPIEVNIDYPEYEDIEVMTNEKIVPKLVEIKDKLNKIIKESENGKIITSGIKTIIIGKPNVGKSSILNKLLDEDKAIVTDIEGTTRDTVEGSITINGVSLDLIDTAGIRDAKDIVEKIGVEKSISLINEADLVIIVLNNNEELTEEDKKILDYAKDKQVIVVINKNDLEKKINEKDIEYKNIIYTNTKESNGINPLKEKIVELFNLEKLTKNDNNILTNIRQISLAKEALSILEDVENGIKDETPIDMIEIDIKRSWEKLGEIIGETYTEELIDQLFSQFCLGK